MMGERADLYEKLMTQFSQEQMHILDKLQETESSLSLTDNANYFSYGFQLGTLMMIEVFTKADRLVGEEEAPPVEK